MRVSITTHTEWHGAPEVERAIALAVEATAGRLQLAAEANISKQDLILTGDMHDDWDIGRTGRFTRTVNSPHFYGQFSEYGSGHQPATPWFRPAVRTAGVFMRRALKAAVPGA